MNKQRQYETMGGGKVDPEKFYTMRELHRLNAFPWIKSLNAVHKFVQDHLEQLGGKKIGNRYFIPGSGVINYLNNFLK